VHEIPFNVAGALPVVGAGLMMNKNPLLAPLKEAITTIQPDADVREVAVKLALLEPCATTTLAGTVRLALLLERATLMSAAAFDIVTVHEAVRPATNFAGVHDNEDKTGVDQSAKLAVCDEEPSVAVTEPVPSAAMVPMVALNVVDAFPAVMTTLPGTVIRPDVEVRPTVVFVRTVWDRLTVQGLIAPDITPVGLHDSELTTNEVVRLIETVCEEPP
jgi:hypothetical protein